jgi:hypothetical protein
MIGMSAVERGSSVSFALVRRGFDPEQVNEHLHRVDTDVSLLATDRAAAVKQADQLTRECNAVRAELDATRAETERLRGELRLMAGPVDTVESMSERVQVVLRLAQHQFSGVRDAVAAQIAEIGEGFDAQAALSADGAGLGPDADLSRRSPFTQQDADRLRHEAAEERARLDEAAAVRRAAADEEFRATLAARCREALAQITAMQAEATRVAQQVLDGADAQGAARVAEAEETARRMVEEARAEVESLHALRRQLGQQLDATRQLLADALPAPRQVPVPHPRQAPSGGPSHAADTAAATLESSVPRPSPVPMAERTARPSPRHAT